MQWRAPAGTLAATALDMVRGALAAVEPGLLTRRALDPLPPPAGPWHLVAVGKGAVAMALAAETWGAAAPLAGGIVVCHHTGPLHPATRTVEGDHPLPGAASAQASAALAAVIAGIAPGEQVCVLLSGGASSLIAEPVAGMTPDELAATVAQLLGAGVPIATINALRQRLLRWGGGRMRAALEARGAIPLTLALSDVPSDDPRLIGSGPMSRIVPSSADASPMEEALSALEPPLRARLGALRSAGALDLPEIAEAPVTIVGSNTTAVDAARRHAREAGWRAVPPAHPLEGEAAPAGIALARQLMALPAGGRSVIVVGGETVVTLGPAHGRGGRSQELALAAALELSGADGVALLAMGTDGRDGPGTAAGALVTGNTVAPAGRAMATEALRRHDSGAWLEQAGALVTTGPTGTNVMDLVIALRH